MTVFVVSGLLLMTTIFATSFTQSDALKEAAAVERDQLRTSMSVASASQITTVDYTTMTLGVDNPGALTLANRQVMDVIVIYTAQDGSSKTKWLPYVATAPPGDNQWTISAISPAAYNPGLWDPGEQVTLKLRFTPPLKAASVATVSMGAPNGVTTSVSVSS